MFHTCIQNGFSQICLKPEEPHYHSNWKTIPCFNRRGNHTPGSRNGPALAPDAQARKIPPSPTLPLRGARRGCESTRRVRERAATRNSLRPPNAQPPRRSGRHALREAGEGRRRGGRGARASLPVLSSLLPVEGALRCCPGEGYGQDKRPAPARTLMREIRFGG